MTLSAISSVVREGVGQGRVMAHGDVGRVVRGPARTGGGQKTVLGRLVPLRGKETVHSLANELRERLRLSGRELLETLVLFQSELNLNTNHEVRIAFACLHGDSGGARRISDSTERARLMAT